MDHREPCNRRRRTQWSKEEEGCARTENDTNSGADHGSHERLGDRAPERDRPERRPCNNGSQAGSNSPKDASIPEIVGHVGRWRSGDDLAQYGQYEPHDGPSGGSAQHQTRRDPATGRASGIAVLLSPHR